MGGVPRLGIGITTFGRRASLERTLEAVARHTRTPHALIVADDGSEDDTLVMLRRRRVPHLTGPNRGIAWNKNRALFHLHRVAGCDVVILLEDDTQPLSDGWERAWIEGARRWGHVNFAGPWFSERIVSGAGTPEDPYLGTLISGQCTAFSRRALDRIGYMDTRFGRYGFEHCDHSERMLEAGYGGHVGPPALYALLASDLAVDFDNHRDYHDELERNTRVYIEVRNDRGWHRWPWRSGAEMARFLREMGGGRLYDRRMQARRVLGLMVTLFRWAERAAHNRLRARPRPPVSRPSAE